MPDHRRLHIGVHLARRRTPASHTTPRSAPPLPRLGDLVGGGIAEISAKRDVTIAVLALAGDGNTRPLIVFDPTDADLTARANRAYGEVMDLAIRLGGTITGEHGVGRLERPWLADYLGPDALALNERIKRALDPQGIVNPGSVFSKL